MTAQSRILSFALIGAMGAAGIGASLLWHRASPPLLNTGTYLAPARKMADFSLIDEHGRRFTSAGLRDHWSLMFFGYTNCPDFCPATLTTLAALQKRLRAAGNAELPQVIFVSVDAARDTPAQLARYVPYFDPGFIGLTAADQPSIDAVAKALGVAVIIRPDAGGGGGYTVDHSGAIFVINPAGRLAAILTGPFTVDALQADWRQIVQAGGILAGHS
jgi:protein SCO1/2